MHNEDADQPAHARTVITSLGIVWIAKDAKFLHVDKEDSDQIALI